MRSQEIFMQYGINALTRTHHPRRMAYTYIWRHRSTAKHAAAAGKTVTSTLFLAGGEREISNYNFTSESNFAVKTPCPALAFASRHVCGSQPCKSVNEQQQLVLYVKWHRLHKTPRARRTYVYAYTSHDTSTSKAIALMIQQLTTIVILWQRHHCHRHRRVWQRRRRWR